MIPRVRLPGLSKAAEIDMSDPNIRGALIGSLVGAGGLGLLGAVTADEKKNRLRRAIWSGLLGAGVGAGAGYAGTHLLTKDRALAKHVSPLSQVGDSASGTGGGSTGTFVEGARVTPASRSGGSAAGTGGRITGEGATRHVWDGPRVAQLPNTASTLGIVGPGAAAGAGIGGGVGLATGYGYGALPTILGRPQGELPQTRFQSPRNAAMPTLAGRSPQISPRALRLMTAIGAGLGALTGGADAVHRYVQQQPTATRGTAP